MAEKQIHSLSVDFSKVEPIKTDIKLKQFEFGSDVFHVSVYDEGKLFDPTGGKVLVCIRIQRPDGKMDEKIIYDTRLSDNPIEDNYVCSNVGNVITSSYFIINPYPFFTFCSGDIKCELWLRVYDDEGNTTINRVSQPFIYQIYKSISSYNMIDKESIDIITALIDAVTGLQATVTYDEYVEKLNGAVKDIKAILDAKVNVIDKNSDDSTYPSSKAVFDIVAALKSFLVEGAPDNLNTVTKLAAAIRNNPNFADDVIADINALNVNTSGAAETINAHLIDYNNPHNLHPGDIGLGHVDNTSDEDKPLSKSAIDALALKVDAIPGMGLSSNDFTELDKIRIEEAYYLMGDLSFLDTQNTDSLVDAINEVHGLASVHIKEGVSGTLNVNTEYYLGITHDLTLTFPSNASPGEVVYINFFSPEQPTVLTIDMTNVFDIEIIPEPDTGYEIFGKYTPDGWIVNYSEFSLDKWYYEEAVGI